MVFLQKDLKKTKVLPYELPTTVCSIPFSRQSAYQMFSIFTRGSNKSLQTQKEKKTAHSKTVSFSFELNGLHHFHRPEVIISYRCKYAQKCDFSQRKINLIRKWLLFAAFEIYETLITQIAFNQMRYLQFMYVCTVHFSLSPLMYALEF